MKSLLWGWTGARLLFWKRTPDGAERCAGEFFLTEGALEWEMELLPLRTGALERDTEELPLRTGALERETEVEGTALREGPDDLETLFEEDELPDEREDDIPDDPPDEREGDDEREADDDEREGDDECEAEEDDEPPPRLA